MITSKSLSFIEVKQAGVFLEKNLDIDEYFISPATSAEIQYHSNRRNIPVSINNSLSNESIKYAVFSIYNPLPDGYVDFINSHQNDFKPVAVFPFTANSQQPAVIIFEIVRN